jgi:Kdo2-lipid IVA lauroyltransferase/acyltransferase
MNFVRAEITKKKLKDYIAKLRPGLLGHCGYYLASFRSKIVNKNIEIAFGDDLTVQEKHKLAKSFYRHIVLFVYEYIRFFWASKKRLGKLVEVEGIENVVEAYNKGKGVVILTGHFGNWEVACLGGISKFPQYEGLFHVMRKTFTNKLFEKVVFSKFRKHGLNVIIARSGLERACEVLKEKNIVVFAFDQRAKLIRKEGVLIDLFSRKASTNKALSLIVRHCGAVVVPATAFRKKGGKHVLSFKKPLEWIECNSSQEATLVNTRLYNRALEEMIEEHPDQWLWGHKRWRLQDSNCYEQAH